jgi:hypothetical protein
VSEPFTIRRGDTFPLVHSQLFLDDTDGPLALDAGSGDSVRWILRPLDGSTLLNAAAVIADGPNGWVEYHWTVGDLTAFPDGPALGEWFVSFGSGGSITVPFPTPIDVLVGSGVADLPTISGADLALLRSLVGDAPSNADLATLLAKLGSTDAVALSVLEGRLLAAIAEPEEYSLDGDLRVKWGVEGRKILQSKVDELKRRTGTYTYMPVPVAGGITFSEREDVDPDIIPAYFHEDMDDMRPLGVSRWWDNRSG